MSGVLVLNAGYEPMLKVSVQHAVKMLVRQVAVVHESLDDRTYGPFPYPKVLRLVRYVSMAWKYRRTDGPPCTKEGIKARDGRCAYCGGKAETVDHVLPRSRGGRSTWLNLVACCFYDNHRKGNRTPAEAGMKLRVTPYVPKWSITA